jgi:hypothetical protein
MNPDEQQQKVIAKGVTEGILKAVGILALLGLIVGMVVAIGNTDFSSGTASSKGLPVTVLVVNATSDSLLFTWRSDTGEVSGQDVIPPAKGSTCERFYAQAAAGKPYMASFEIRDPRSGQRDSSGWFQLGGYATAQGWVDTVRAVGHRGVVRVHDLNLLARSNCQAY